MVKSIEVKVFIDDVSSYYASSRTMANRGWHFSPSPYPYIPVYAHHHYSHSPQTQEDRENSRATNAALLGGLATVLFAGITTFLSKNAYSISRSFNKAVEFRDVHLPKVDSNIHSQLKPIVDKHIKILEKNLTWSKSVTVLSAFALGAGVTAFTGGMFAAQGLITLSAIAAIAIAAIGVSLTVAHFTDETNCLPPKMLETVDKIWNQYHDPAMEKMPKGLKK